MPGTTGDPQIDRGLTFYLYLSKESPLIQHLNFPEGFDIDKTPLLLHKR